MEIIIVNSDKKRVIDLLLIADESESMIDNYLERGDFFALYDIMFEDGVQEATSTPPDSVTL